MNFTKLKDTITTVFSGDNSKIDFTHVNSALWICVVLCVWVYKSSEIVGGLADIPPGVVMVVCTLIGAAPVSAGVNLLNRFRSSPQTLTQTASVINTATVVTESDDEDPKP